MHGNLAHRDKCGGILGDRVADPKGLVGGEGEVWGGRYTSYRSRDLGRALGLSPEKKDIFSLEMARFGEF